MPLIGIIATPSSGKDIRRLVADADGIDNQHKANIVRRVLRGIAAIAGTTSSDSITVAVMPEQANIRRRAVDGLEFPFPVDLLDSPCRGVAEDSQAAARQLADRGAAVIIVLGGDGTHRMVAKGCLDVPLLPISTGTNNVWPKRNEGTLAGIAAALVAERRVPAESACRQTPRLDVLRDGRPIDMALVDVAVCDIPVPGAKAPSPRPRPEGTCAGAVPLPALPPLAEFSWLFTLLLGREAYNGSENEDFLSDLFGCGRKL